MSPVSSAIGTNSAGSSKPAFGVTPPHQRFEVAHPSGGQIEDRLVVHLELVAFERSAQRGLDVEPAHVSRAQGFIEHGHLSAPGRSLARYIAASASLSNTSGRDFLVGGRRSGITMEERDANARGHIDLGAVDREHVLEHTLDSFGRFDGLRFIVEILGENDELVAAESGHRVVRPQGARQLIRDLC